MASALRTFFLFECRYLLRQRSFQIICLIFFIWSSLLVSHPYFNAGIAFETINSPISIVMGISITTAALPLFIAIFFANTIIRDKEVKIDHVLFVFPIKSYEYLLGRFFAVIMCTLLLFTVAAAGVFISPIMPWVDNAMVGEVHYYPYFYAFFVFVVPNTLFIGSFLILLASLTRSLRHTFIGVVLFYVLHGLSGLTLRHSELAYILDPFGIKTFFNFHYDNFSSGMLGTVMPILSDSLLANRGVWLTIAIIMLVTTLVSFRLRTDVGKSGEPAKDQEKHLPIKKGNFLSISWTPYFPIIAGQWSAITLFDVRSIVQKIPFKLLTIIAIVLLINDVFEIKEWVEPRNALHTSVLAQSLYGLHNTVLILLMVFFAGELIFKERDLNVDPIIDSLPVSGATWFSAKCIALSLSLVIYQLIAVLLLLSLQSMSNITIEPLTLVTAALLSSVKPLLFGLAALSVFTLINNKYLGYFIFAAVLALQLLHLDGVSTLLHFGKLPELHYSDLIGYGHYLKGWMFFVTYWILITIGFVMMAITYWPRGEQEKVGGHPLLNDIRNFSVRGVVPILLILLTIGVFTWRVEQAIDVSEYQQHAADYEKRYQRFATTPQPIINGVYAELNIFPEQREVSGTLKYLLKNESKIDIEELLIDYPTDIQLTITEDSLGTVIEQNKELGWVRYKLNKASLPGEEFQVYFNITRLETLNSGAWYKNKIQFDSTFLTSSELFPQLGYNPQKELKNTDDRITLGLSTLPSEPNPDHHELFIGGHFKLIDFEAIISTVTGQQVITSGNLIKNWQENQREFYHFRSDKKILPFIGIVSGDYQVTSANSELNQIPVHVYHSPKHSRNVSVLLNAAKRTLDLFSEKYSDFHLPQLTIAEIPYHLPYGQSFAGSVVLSERSGFTADLNDRPHHTIDRFYFIVAHEVAHQWWAHQLVPGYHQGASILTESLAQYSALIALEERYGKEYLQRVLLDEQDRYFRSRKKDERPLADPSAQPLHVAYHKGGTTLYGLSELIGRERFDRSLKRLLSLQKKLNTVSIQDFINILLDESPREYRTLVNDLFYKTTVASISVEHTEIKQMESGHWQVRAIIKYKLLDSHGNFVSPSQMSNLPVEVEIRSERGNDGRANTVLNSSILVLNGDITETEILVNQEPGLLVIDPQILIIEPNRSDNTVKF